jgi:hypothetical protein
MRVDLFKESDQIFGVSDLVDRLGLRIVAIEMRAAFSSALRGK